MNNQNFSKFLNKGISTPVGIFIIVLVAIIAGGIMIWQYSEIQKEEFKPTEIKIPEKTEDETTDWKDYRLEECEKFQLKDHKNKCYMEVARDTRNPEICDKIAKDQYQKEEYQKEECYVNIAMINRDSTICKEVRDQFYRNWCLKIIEGGIFIPEEVTTNFFRWYIGVGHPSNIQERIDVTEKYKQKIAKSISTQFMVDPVILAQDLPGGFDIGEAIIINDSCSLIVTLKYSKDYDRRVELLSIDDQWKIDNITFSK